MENQLDIQILAREIGLLHITIMQLRAENEFLKSKIQELEGEE